MLQRPRFPLGRVCMCVCVCMGVREGSCSSVATLSPEAVPSTHTPLCALLTKAVPDTLGRWASRLATRLPTGMTAQR